jgi:hypothetical protein
MIVVAPTALAAMRAASPTAPVPEMTMLAPAPTLRVLITAPAPVWMPQPRGPVRSRSMPLGILTALRAVTRAWVAKEDWPKKLPCTTEPSSPVRVVEPSSRAPAKFSVLMLSQYAGRRRCVVGSTDVLNPCRGLAVRSLGRVR